MAKNKLVVLRSARQRLKRVRNRVDAPGTSIFGKLQSAVMRLMANPVAIVAIALCITLASTSQENPAEKWVKDLGTKMQQVSWLKGLGQYMTENSVKALGASVLSIVALFTGRKSEGLSFAVMAVVAVVVLPVYSSWNYGWAAALLALSLQMRNPLDRILLGVIGVMVYVTMFLENTNGGGQASSGAGPKP